MAKKYLIFRLNDDLFAVPLADVKEVVALSNIVSVPNTQRHVLGLMNLRGKVISAIDLKDVLLLPKRAKGRRVPLVLFESFNGLCACLVDEVIEVLSVAEEQISAVEKSHYTATLKLPNRPMILLVDISTVVNTCQIGKAG